MPSESRLMELCGLERPQLCMATIRAYRPSIILENLTSVVMLDGSKRVEADWMEALARPSEDPNGRCSSSDSMAPNLNTFVGPIGGRKENA